MTTHDDRGTVGSVSELHTGDLHSATHNVCTTAADVRLSTHDVCNIAGITYRQATFWLTCGYIHAEHYGEGTGVPRQFTLPQLRRVVLVAWLTKGGLTPQQAVALIDGDVSFLLAAFPGGAT